MPTSDPGATPPPPTPSRASVLPKHKLTHTSHFKIASVPIGHDHAETGARAKNGG